MWQAAPSSLMAAELSGWSMTSRRNAASPERARAGVAMTEARQANPMDRSSRVGVVIPLWQARHRSEVANNGPGAAAAPGGRGGSAAPTPAAKGGGVGGGLRP